MRNPFSTIADRIDAWYRRPWGVSAEGLALSRMLYSGYILFLMMKSTAWIGEYPPVFYSPPLSLSRLFSSFPPTWFFHSLNVAFVISLVAMFFGYKTKAASIAFFVVFFIYISFAHSFGKVDHLILFLLFPLLMAFSNWGAAWSVDAARSAKNLRADRKKADDAQFQEWPLTILAILFAFSMFTAGYFKITTEWLSLDSQAIQSKIFSNYYAQHRESLLAGFVIGIRSAWLWEVLDWLVVGMEFLIIFALPFRGLFRVFLSFSILFHFGVFLTMNIDYSIHAVILAVYVNWNWLPVVMRSSGGILKKFYAFLQPVLLIPIAGAFVAVLYWKGSLLNVFLSPFRIGPTLVPGMLFLGGGTMICIVFWVSLLRNAVSRKGESE